MSCSHILVFVVILYSLEHITRDIEIINDDRIYVFRRCVPSRRASTGINTGSRIESKITFSYICFPVDTVRQTDDCSLPSHLDLP